MGTTESPNLWAGVLLLDQEALQIITVLADVHDGHHVRDAVGAAWSLLSNRLGAQAGGADPRPEYLASLWTASRIGPARGSSGHPIGHRPVAGHFDRWTPTGHS